MNKKDWSKCLEIIEQRGKLEKSLYRKSQKINRQLQIELSKVREGN